MECASHERQGNNNVSICRESADLIESIASRDIRIARLDTSLQQREKEVAQLKEELRILECESRDSILFGCCREITFKVE